MYEAIFLVAVVLCVVPCQPLSIPTEQSLKVWCSKYFEFNVWKKHHILLKTDAESLEDNSFHELSKRFINPWLMDGGFSKYDLDLRKIRSKRSYEEECEKLRLCRLHARSNQNFFAAFELYFVNRENARLWDHRAHSLAECNQRYSCYR